MGSCSLASRAGRGTLCAGEIWTCILVSRCLVSGKFIVVMQKGTGAKCVVFVFRACACACVFGLIVYLKVYVLLLNINQDEKANLMNFRWLHQNHTTTTLSSPLLTLRTHHLMTAKQHARSVMKKWISILGLARFPSPPTSTAARIHSIKSQVSPSPLPSSHRKIKFQGRKNRRGKGCWVV